MTIVVADRVLETTTTSGTGTLSLSGAVAGYQSFVTGIGSGNTTYYTIYDSTAQVWEVGIGTVTSGTPNTLSRTTVLSNSSGNTSPLTLAGNAANVFCSYPAEEFGIATSVAQGATYSTGTYTLTSSTGQGSNPLTYDNNVLLSATGNNAVTLPTPVAGNIVRVWNATAYTVSVYPSSGCTIANRNVNEASTLNTMSTGLGGSWSEFVATSSTTWTDADQIQYASIATTATNIAGGEADKIPYQTAAATTAFIAAPTSSGQILEWNGSAFTWTSNDGWVTGVTATSPVASTGGSTPVISLGSGYGDTQNPYASKTANYFLAAPNGSSGTPSFRAIVAADIPTLNQNTTGSASTLANTGSVSTNSSFYPVLFSANSTENEAGNTTADLNYNPSTYAYQAGYLISTSNGLGYETGLSIGGTVTQDTSRTTGVTLNKPTGAITLYAAAGSTTATTFTVTNSTVAATDTIVLNQKSGTNLYLFFVTAVAAGSFNITFYTTGGTSSDSPVINFTVHKGSNN
jgi:hypothetical protein